MLFVFDVAVPSPCDVPGLPVNRPSLGGGERAGDHMVLRGSPPPLLPAYAPLAPYNVVVVELNEAPSLRLVGNLVAREGGAFHEVDPASITIGDPVRAVFSERTGADGTVVTLPFWVREGAAAG